MILQFAVRALIRKAPTSFVNCLLLCYLTATNVIVKTLLTHPRIRSIAWNPTGHLIATGSADKTLRIWNPEKNQVKNSTELRGHTGGIERVAWNPIKEAELASVSSDCTCKFWDVRNKTCLATVQIGEPGFSVTWAADGSVCLVGLKVSFLAIYVYRLPPFKYHSHRPPAVAVSCKSSVYQRHNHTK